MSDVAPKTETPCRTAGSLHRIDTKAHSNIKTFVVHVAKANGSHASGDFTAKELSSYRAFVTACLGTLGIIFGDDCFEHRGGAANWREEVARALGRGKVFP